MTTLEIAQKYGVPTPETCKQLDFQGETNFFWEKSVKAHGIWRIRYKEFHRGEHCMDIKAPQMHEIAPLLPYWCEVTMKGMRDQYVLKYDYKENEQVKSITINLKDLEIAEAYAQLYLKLKNENLL